MDLDLKKIEAERMKWSIQTFTEATAQSSLNKAKGEIEEIQEDFNNGSPRAEEFVDAIMCLFDSAQRAGFTYDDIVREYRFKTITNKARKWKKNPDNSYSHV